MHVVKLTVSIKLVATAKMVIMAIHTHVAKDLNAPATANALIIWHVATKDVSAHASVQTALNVALSIIDHRVYVQLDTLAMLMSTVVEVRIIIKFKKKISFLYF